MISVVGSYDQVPSVFSLSGVSMSDFKAKLCEALGIVSTPNEGELIGRLCRDAGALQALRYVVKHSGDYDHGGFVAETDEGGVTGPSKRDFEAFHSIQSALMENRLPDPTLAAFLNIPGGVWSWPEVARQLLGIAERESMRAGDGPLHYVDMTRKLHEVESERDQLAARVAELEAATDQSTDG